MKIDILSRDKVPSLYLKVKLFSAFKVYKDTKASEVCQELASKRALAPDLNWALFQNVNNELGKQTLCVDVTGIFYYMFTLLCVVN